MPESRQSGKKKKVLVRDLSKVSVQDLDKNAAHTIKGGLVLSCGHEGDSCQAQTVVIDSGFEHPEELVVLGPAARARTMKKMR
jgi:hypothetical protein